MQKIKKEITENKDIIVAMFIVLAIFAVIIFLWNFFNLPNQKDLIEIVKSFFSRYGLPVIFFASILESILLIGNYFPGSLVIFLGVSVASGNVLLAVKTIVATCAGMLIGYNVNYLLGKFGLYKAVEKFGYKNEIDKLQNKIERDGIKAGFFFYIIPGFGSLISTTFGILKYNYIKFLLFTIVTTVFWNSLWGALVYFFGMKIFDALSSYVSMFVIFIAYIVYMYKSGKFEELKNKQT
jgi:membrane protein DedA with SNARE-associated domain